MWNIWCMINRDDIISLAKEHFPKIIIGHDGFRVCWRLLNEVVGDWFSSFGCSLIGRNFLAMPLILTTGFFQRLSFFSLVFQI